MLRAADFLFRCWRKQLGAFCFSGRDTNNYFWTPKTHEGTGKKVERRNTCFMEHLFPPVIFSCPHLCHTDALHPSLHHSDFYLSPWPSVKLQHPVRRWDEAGRACVCACVCVCMRVWLLSGYCWFYRACLWQRANYTPWVSAVNASQA